MAPSKNVLKMFYHVTNKKCICNSYWKSVFNTLDLDKNIYIFEGFNIAIIKIFNFQNMCINMHDGSHINNTLFE
jgi:hypothetical protein